MEPVCLVPILKNAVSGVIETVDVGNAVALAVDENFTVVFIKRRFLPFANVPEMAGVFGNYLVVEIDALAVLAQVLVEAFEIPGIGREQVIGLENMAVVAAEISAQDLKMHRIGTWNAFTPEIDMVEITRIQARIRLAYRTGRQHLERAGMGISDQRLTSVVFGVVNQLVFDLVNVK